MGRRRIAALITILLVVAACQRHTVSPSPPPAQPAKTVQTMLIGIDQFDGGDVWGLNTGHGVFVVGPETPRETKETLYSHLVEARDTVITIAYRDIPAGRRTVAHRRATTIRVQETTYRLE